MNKLQSILRVVLFSILTLIVVSCKSRKHQTNSGENASVVYKFKDVKSVLNNKEINFETLDANVKIVLETDKKISAKANLRMVKDESVWMSVSYLGIEVARLKMDKEGVNVLDKFNKKHYVLEYKSWNEKYGTEFTITHFQKLLLGIPVENINRQFKWEQKRNVVEVDNQKSSDELYWLFYQINQSALLDQHIVTSESKLECEYSEEKVKKSIPKHIGVNILMKNPVKVDIKTNRVELNKTLKMPFKVSSKYAKVVL